MGPKRAANQGQARGARPPQDATVTVGNTKNPNQKTGGGFKRQPTSSLNVSLPTVAAKSHIPQPCTTRQSRNTGYAGPPGQQSKTTPRNLSMVHLENANPSNRSVGPSRASTTKLKEMESGKRRPSPIPKDARTNSGRNVGRRQWDRRCDNRVSMGTHLHPVAFIKDESKSFKQKTHDDSNKSQTNFQKSCTVETPILDPVTSKGNLSTEKVSEIASERDFDSVTVCLNENDVGRCSAVSRLLQMEKEESLLGYRESCVEAFNVNFTPSILLPSMDSDTLTNASDITFSETVTETGPTLSVKEFKIENDDGKFENNIAISNVNKITERNENYLEIVDKNGCKFESKLSPYAPSFICDTVPTNFGETYSGISNSYRIQTNELDSDKKLENKVDETIVTCQSENMVEGVGEADTDEVKHSVSVTTVKSSNDGKTFVVEEPFVFHGLEVKVEMDKKEMCQDLQVEQNSPEVGLECNLTGDQNETHSIQCDESEPVKSHSIHCDASEPVTIVKDDGKELSELKLDQCEDVVPALDHLPPTVEPGGGDMPVDVEPLDALEAVAARASVGIEGALGDTDILLQTGIFTCEVENSDDEFDLESQEMVHEVDLSNCVWVDYKIPVGVRVEPEDDEAWIVEDNDDMDGTIEELEVATDATDWLVAERDLARLRFYLDECGRDADAVARQAGSLTGRAAKTSVVRSNKTTKDFSLDDIQLMSVDETVPSETQPVCDRRADPVDDIDYYSVSSGDEMDEVAAKDQVEPRSSYLSFGKSCAMHKQKSNKKIFTSFFNLFK